MEKNNINTAMKFNNSDELVSYIVKFFESQYKNSDSDLNNLAKNIATTLYIFFDSSLEIPEHKLKLILTLITVTYTTGKYAVSKELNDKLFKCNKK